MPQVPLEKWQDYLNYIGLKNSTVAVDSKYEAIKASQVRTAGATVILNKKGHVMFRDRSATSYEQLKMAVSMAL